MFRNEVIYKGAKFFEKYEKKVEILLINHEGCSCIEVIIHGVRVGNKPARLYLNSTVLVTMMNVGHFNRTLDVKQKAANKLGLPFDSSYEMKKLALNILSTLLVEGLRIIPSIFLSEFDLCFELNGQSYMEDNNVIEYAVMPRDLVPFVVLASFTEDFSRKPQNILPKRVLATQNSYESQTSFGSTRSDSSFYTEEEMQSLENVKGLSNKSQIKPNNNTSKKDIKTRMLLMCRSLVRFRNKVHVNA